MAFVRSLAMGIVLAAALAGCAAPSGSTTAPAGVSVSVYQTRTDVGPRRLELSVRNDSAGDLLITGARFLSEQFVQPAEWAKDSTTVRAGTTVDLPVLLPAPDCSAGAPEASVEFDYVLEDGTTGTARVPADDRLDRLASLMVEDCTAQAVSDVVRLTITASPRAGTIAGMPVVELDLDADPTGAEGSVELVGLSTTTLFMTPDPSTGLPTSGQPIGTTIRGTDPPSVVTLVLTPGRCDPHAIAEDKRGTIMPIDVVVDGTAGRIYVPAADPVRGALYQFVTDACA